MAKAKKTAKKSEQKTLVTFLLDRTQSMGVIKNETISGFNAYLDTLKKQGQGIEFTFLQFDSISIDKVHVAVPIADVPPLNAETYQPRAWTPLIDAAFKTIKAVEESLKKRDDKPKIVITFQTDGQENSSREHTFEELSDLIKAKTKDGWQFNFMGTGIDAYAQGARMGVAIANTVSTGTTRDEIHASMSASASNAARFSSGMASSTEYSLRQKSASGDKHVHKYQGNPVVPVPPAPSRSKAKIVDDFSL